MEASDWRERERASIDLFVLEGNSAFVPLFRHMWRSSRNAQLVLVAVWGVVQKPIQVVRTHCNDDSLPVKGTARVAVGLCVQFGVFSVH